MTDLLPALLQSWQWERPVALLAKADERDTRGFISMIITCRVTTIHLKAHTPFYSTLLYSILVCC